MSKKITTKIAKTLQFQKVELELERTLKDDVVDIPTAYANDLQELKIVAESFSPDMQNWANESEAIKQQYKGRRFANNNYSRAVPRSNYNQNFSNYNNNYQRPTYNQGYSQNNFGKGASQKQIDTLTRQFNNIGINLTKDDYDQLMSPEGSLYAQTMFDKLDAEKNKQMVQNAGNGFENK